MALVGFKLADIPLTIIDPVVISARDEGKAVAALVDPTAAADFCARNMDQRDRYEWVDQNLDALIQIFGEKYSAGQVTEDVTNGGIYTRVDMELNDLRSAAHMLTR